MKVVSRVHEWVDWLDKRLAAKLAALLDVISDAAVVALLAEGSVAD